MQESKEGASRLLQYQVPATVYEREVLSIVLGGGVVWPPSSNNTLKSCDARSLRWRISVTVVNCVHLFVGNRKVPTQPDPTHPNPPHPNPISTQTHHVPRCRRALVRVRPTTVLVSIAGISGRLVGRDTHEKIGAREDGKRAPTSLASSEIRRCASLSIESFFY